MNLPATVVKRQSGKTGAQEIAEAEAILHDRVMGMPLSQMMEKYNLSRATVYRRCKQALDYRLPVTVDAYREQQNTILDEQMSRLNLQLQVVDGMIELAMAKQSVSDMERAALLQSKTLDTMTRLLDRRARLNGLDAPVRVDAVVTEVTQADVALQEMLAEAKAKAAAAEALIVQGEQ